MDGFDEIDKANSATIYNSTGLWSQLLLEAKEIQARSLSAARVFYGRFWFSPTKACLSGW